MFQVSPNRVILACFMLVPLVLVFDSFQCYLMKLISLVSFNTAEFDVPPSYSSQTQNNQDPFGSWDAMTSASYQPQTSPSALGTTSDPVYASVDYSKKSKPKLTGPGAGEFNLTMTSHHFVCPTIDLHAQDPSWLLF